MKIAIVGNNSSISQALIPCFSSGEEILTLGRKNADIEIDLNGKNNISLPDGIDAIIHTAAHFGGTSKKDFVDTIQVNLIGTVKLLDAAIRAEAKQFVYISSIYSHLKADSKLYNIYSITKKCSEEVLKLYSMNKPIILTILRPSQLYGNFHSNRLHQPFFYSIIDKIRNNENVTFYGKHNPKRNFLHIADMSQIIHQSVIKKIPGDYDCAFPINTSFLEVANAAKSAFNSNSLILFDETMPDMTDLNIEFETSIYDRIAFWPIISLNMGMQMLADYLEKENYAG